MVLRNEKNLLQLRAFSGFQLIPDIKFAYHYIADEVIRQLLSPKGILIVDCYLILIVKNFLRRF